MPSTVSVIVPAYRVEDYLDECVASILGQTYSWLEVILIDDGSPDACPQMCDSWGDRDSRVRVVHQTNQGVSAARNAGLELATGDYITFVDGDDVVAHDLVETLVGMAARHNAQLVVVAQAPFGTDPPCFVPGTTLQVASGDATTWRIVGVKPQWEAWGKLYERRLFETVRFRTDIRNGEDLEATVRVLAEVDRGVVSDAALYGYRVREDGAMGLSRQGPPVDLIIAIGATIDFTRDRLGSSSEEYQRLLVACVLLAAKKLEEIRSWRAWRSSDEYRRAYRVLLNQRWAEVRLSRLLSRPYRLALVLSRFAPTAFVMGFGLARILKRSMPGLRRRRASGAS